MTSYQISQADKNCKNAIRAVATGPSDLGCMGEGGGAKEGCNRGHGLSAHCWYIEPLNREKSFRLI